MPDLTLVLIGMLILAIAWMAIKLIFKLTIKIFSCGFLLILVIGAFLFFSGYLSFS